MPKSSHPTFELPPTTHCLHSQVCNGTRVAHSASVEAARCSHAVCGCGWQRQAVPDAPGVPYHGHGDLPD